MTAGTLPAMGTTGTRARPFLVVEAKHDAHFDPGKHPRDQHGKFISIGAHITFGHGPSYEVTHVSANGATVKRADGTTTTVSRDTLKGATVTSSPPDGGHAVAGAAAAEHAVTPHADAPGGAAHALAAAQPAASDAEAIRVLESSVTSDISPSSQEMRAVNEYVGQAYNRINKALRTGDTSLLDETDTKNIDSLKALADQHPLPESIVVHRGVRAGAKETFGENAVGLEFRDQGFASTTTSEEFARHHAGKLPRRHPEEGDSAVIRVTLPKGMPVVPVGQVREGRSGIDQLHRQGRDTSRMNGNFEEEVLLKPGVKMRVVKDSIETDPESEYQYRVLDVEVVPDQADAPTAPSAPTADGSADPAKYGQGSYADLEINGKSGDARPGGPTEPSIVGLDRNQNRAVDQYQADSITQALNGALRNGQEPTGKIGYWDPAKMGGELAPLLDSAINAGTIKKDTTLWRGVQLTPEQAAQYVPGAVVQDLGYWSTSFSEGTADQFIDYRKREGAAGYKFRLLTPAGTHAVKGTEDLSELILPRGSRVRVVSVVGNTITAEVMP